jgi:hypothetical protein
MARVGGGNPVPFEVGGGPSSSELACNAMKSAVGQGGSAADDTIEAAWRWARARGLRASFCDSRAAVCYFTDRTADAIETYEEILQIAASPDSSDEARRLIVVDKWIGTIDMSTAALEDRLQEIDSRFSILENDSATSTVTQHGRAFEDWDSNDPDACGPDFGVDKTSTSWPNYASDFNCEVLYALGEGPITTTIRRTLESARQLLIDSLPAWVEFTIVRTTTGFILDIDLLDLGGFGT